MEHVKNRFSCLCAHVPQLYQPPFLALYDPVYCGLELPPEHQAIAVGGRERLIARTSRLLNQNLVLSRLPRVQAFPNPLSNRLCYCHALCAFQNHRLEDYETLRVPHTQLHSR